jgi:hypothetical protein
VTAPNPLAAFAPHAADLRAECEHKRTLYIEVIDRVPVKLLLALLDHAYPPGGYATSGYTSMLYDTPPQRHAAEIAWAEAWKRFDRPVARATSVSP